ncbi:Gfo/Idh/MocA family oxidoreductase [Salinisphaera sp. USBA-960]|uniref:Gfo/Idh/MocA family protein n=1 Tax=Salinisphaera orenii TaxID=856731 RepID=UPI000DBE9F31|nr:Gfo/Idh/MocA family oxidoreductase [Salifodinibacter halophilus]NNC25670.1 Gfo/Idh/MocA family oxidoreductase [Salifodinibacter halophilus]
MKAFENRIRIGMVGGGPGANIATAHRMGLRMDGRYALIAGAFSRDAEKNKAMGAELGLDEGRVYTSYERMARDEAVRADGIEAVAIVTPNDSHYPAAKAFLEQGVHVICDKPLTDDFEHGLELHRLAVSKGLVFALTHNYASHSMIRQAATMVADGKLGTIRSVQGEFAANWGAQDPAQDADNKQLAWRTDPAQVGRASVLYDLGTHIHHLARFVTGLEIEALSADLATVVPGRQVYDHAQMSLRFTGGARGGFWVTMVATGAEHGLRIRVVGSKASLEWFHEDPHHLRVSYPDGRHEVLAQAGSAMDDESNRLTRVGIGHPEAFPESFANLYSETAEAIAAARNDEAVPERRFSFPTTRDGVLGLQFVDCVCASADDDGRWVEIAPLDI